tara:strand:+ start:411 stop:638 length:228 start_codon:yes stop_codon:yes gene_type:complete
MAAFQILQDSRPAVGQLSAYFMQLWFSCNRQFGHALSNVAIKTRKPEMPNAGFTRPAITSRAGIAACRAIGILSN